MCARQPLRTQEVNRDQFLVAAQTAAAVQLAYAHRGTSLAHAALAGAQRFVEFQHCPRNDVSDARAGTKFYYHAHRHDAAEHGHFHLFSYGSGGRGDFVHLAALSLNHQGQATQWFTTNQWVTGERWESAEHVLAALAAFEVHTRGRLAPVAEWLTAMVRLFQPQLEVLVHERDRVMAHHIGHERAETVWANRNIDVLSTTPADLHQRIQQLGV